MRFLVVFLLICSVAQGETIQTARGPREVNDGDVIKRNSMWTGQVENLDNVTFDHWNFSRKVPHTEVFVNCHNLKFVECNLVNVELQDDFVIEECLTIHVEEWKQDGKHYRKVECGDNKIRTYETTSEDVDIVDEELPSLSIAQKVKIKEKYKKARITIIEHRETTNLIKTEGTPNDKKIKGIRISR